VEDEDAKSISYLGRAAYEQLRRTHGRTWRSCWNVTSGSVVGRVHDTLQGGWDSTADPEPGHSDWLPKKMGEIMSRTQHWCDLASLTPGPPAPTPDDGLWMDCIRSAIKTVNANAVRRGGDPVIIRMIFGTMGPPVNVSATIKDLVSGIDESDGCNIQLWVGTWRHRLSWNHAKIIAVDGKYLHQGGHNLWDGDYLRRNPLHDISMEAYGQCTHDAHLFMNEHWDFIRKTQSSFVGWIVDKLHDGIPLPLQSQVAVSEFPEDGKTETFPPAYAKERVPLEYETGQGCVPMITLGRYGSIVNNSQAADDAFLAMMGAAKHAMRFVIQDIGPPTPPGLQRVTVFPWPAAYLEAIGRAILRGVRVEMVLSNPGSIPGDLGWSDRSYGFGWTCADVAAEIIKTIKDQLEDDQLRKTIQERLHLCYIRRGRKNTYSDGANIGLHSKFFILDDTCYYLGSQNLYQSNLAEWGILVDDAAQTTRVMNEYWHPIWSNSYQEGQDCDADEVLEGLLENRGFKGSICAGYSDMLEALQRAA